jgi:hypothetical protein
VEGKDRVHEEPGAQEGDGHNGEPEHLQARHVTVDALEFHRDGRETDNGRRQGEDEDRAAMVQAMAK